MKKMKFQQPRHPVIMKLSRIEVVIGENMTMDIAAVQFALVLFVCLSCLALS